MFIVEFVFRFSSFSVSSLWPLRLAIKCSISRGNSKSSAVEFDQFRSGVKWMSESKKIERSEENQEKFYFLHRLASVRETWIRVNTVSAHDKEKLVEMSETIRRSNESRHGRRRSVSASASFIVSTKAFMSCVKWIACKFPIRKLSTNRRDANWAKPKVLNCRFSFSNDIIHCIAHSFYFRSIFSFLFHFILKKNGKILWRLSVDFGLENIYSAPTNFW